MPCAPYDQRNILFQLNGQTCITLKSNQYIQMQYFLTNPKYQPHCTNISIDVWIDPPPPPTRKRVCCPPGMLLRYFVNFYDMEIIEEEAFLAWKEDITQEFPGKGKALFQVPGRLAVSSLTSGGDSPHLTPCLSLSPPLRSTSGSPGWRRRRRRSRTTTQTEAAAAALDRPHLDLTVAPFFCFLLLLVVGFLFSLHPPAPIIRKSALDLTTSGAARSCISLRK